MQAIADRNHDGVVDAKDIEIRDPDDGVKVSVADIFDAELGQVTFNVSTGSVMATTLQGPVRYLKPGAHPG